MLPERQWDFRIQHIVDAMTFEQFAEDDRTVDAVIRNFLIIGEATPHVPDHVRKSVPAVPWNVMGGMRHVLVHDYDAVRLDVVWRTVVDDLPALIDPLQRMLDA